MIKVLRDGSPSLESHLTTRLRAGDHAAFEEVFNTYGWSLRAFARQELKSEALAEDAVQEVFCTLWLRRHTLDAQRSLKGFLFTCLKNHILNVIRTRKNEVLKNYRFAYGQPKHSEDVEHQVMKGEVEQRVNQMISHLPELKKDILTLSIYRGLSNEQIAQRMGVSVNTVKSYLSQSSRQLRRLINLHAAKLIGLFFLSVLP